MRTFSAVFLILLTGCNNSVSTLHGHKASQLGDKPGQDPGTDPVTSFKPVTQGLLGRSVGPEIVPQFQAFFPNKNIPDLLFSNYKRLVRDGGLTDPQGNKISAGAYENLFPSTKALNDPSRPMGVSAQLNWDRLIADLCENTRDTGDDKANVMFKEDAALILGPGEKFPTDPDVRRVFVAVRRAWRAPLTENAPEIVSLVKNYRLAKTSLGSVDEADRALCQAVMLAPQFWLGTGDSSDPVRKLYTRLLNQLPTIAQIIDVTSGKHTLGQVVKDFQSNSTEEYVNAVWRWLDWQLGLDTNSNNSMGPNFTYFGNAAAWNAFSSEPYRWFPTHWDGIGETFIVNDSIESWKYGMYGGGCDGGEEAFDPRTIGMAIYYNGQLLAKRQDGQSDSSGSYNGVSFTMDDFSNFDENYNYNSRGPIKLKDDGGTMESANYSFMPGKFAQAFGGQVRDWHDAIRAYRITPLGEQRGRSKVKLWYGGEAWACNSIVRPLLTCADVWPRAYGTFLTNPGYWSSRACGRPDPKQINSTTADYVIPKGFDVNAPLNPSQLNDVAVGQPGIRFEGLRADYPSGKRTAHPNTYPIVRLLNDMDREGERFVKYLIRNNRDFRDLVSADWTIGGDQYRLFLATDAQPMAAYPPGFEQYYDAGHRANLTRVTWDEKEMANSVIHETEIQPFSVNYVFKNGVSAVSQKRNMSWDNWGVDQGLASSKPTCKTPGRSEADLAADPLCSANPDHNKFVYWGSKGQLAPRPFSGILTMPTFLGPVSSKTRSIAARITQRLLCRLPNEVALTDSQQAAQIAYIPTIEEGGHAHADPAKGCFSCHRTLDPLASALSAAFPTRVGSVFKTDVLGEFMTSPACPTGSLCPYDGWRWGTPNMKGTGMFKGQVVHGFKEVGKAIAASDEFADCSVRTAFTNIYGRSPTQPDLGVIDTVKKKFVKNGYNYNSMIVDLVEHPAFSLKN